MEEKWYKRNASGYTNGTGAPEQMVECVFIKVEEGRGRGFEPCSPVLPFLPFFFFTVFLIHHLAQTQTQTNSCESDSNNNNLFSS